MWRRWQTLYRGTFTEKLIERLGPHLRGLPTFGQLLVNTTDRTRVDGLWDAVDKSRMRVYLIAIELF